MVKTGPNDGETIVWPICMLNFISFFFYHTNLIIHSIIGLTYEIQRENGQRPRKRVQTTVKPLIGQYVHFLNFFRFFFYINLTIQSHIGVIFEIQRENGRRR